MKIVIDISEHDKNIIGRFVRGDDGYDDLPVNIIENLIRGVYLGSLLPKGHGRLIDADKLRLHEKDVQQGNVTWLMDVYTKAEIEDAPTVIPADKENSDETCN